MSIEAIVLTGGKSSRMGEDKSKLPIGGVPQGERIVRLLLDAGIPVTVLGREPIEGAGFLEDKSEFQGPISALSAFHPQADHVFVASCDLPKFEVNLVRLLEQRIGDAEACAPEVDGFRQPLCALYTGAAFQKLEATQDQCATDWLNALATVIVSEKDLEDGGVRPAAARGANTPEELAKVLEEAKV